MERDDIYEIHVFEPIEKDLRSSNNASVYRLPMKLLNFKNVCRFSLQIVQCTVYTKNNQ